MYEQKGDRMSVVGSAGERRPREELVPWTQEQFDGFGKRFAVAKHRLHETGLFSDEALIELIDEYPRHRLQAFTMGTDPERLHELQPVDTKGVPGRDVIAALKVGRLWFKLQRLDLWKGPYADAVRSLYAGLERGSRHFKALQYSAVLLLGSTDSQVYFHADAKPNMLWHIRGRKQFWLYPPTDTKFLAQETLEDIFENVQDEEAPYSEDFDAHAKWFDLKGGDVLSWPQNSPHRVYVAEGLSVSISSFHQTDDSVRRGHIYGANRLLRRSLGLRNLSTRERGLVPFAKALTYRTCYRTKLAKSDPGRMYRTDLRVDPAGARGVSRIPTGKVLTEFSAGLKR
ncbi:MAG: cupin-like domain-containing protein [Candidatus Rokuibacteriota bacterium]